jgi:hypothetical protein
MGIADLPRPVGYVLGGGASLGAIQVGMLQALSEHDVVPDIVAGTSVGSLNGAVVALDPASAANRLSHLWPRLTREQVFPGGLLHQARTLQHAKTHLFPSTGLAAVIADFLGPDATFADLTLPFTAMAMDVATARPHVLSDGPLLPALLASTCTAPSRCGSPRWTSARPACSSRPPTRPPARSSATSTSPARACTARPDVTRRRPGRRPGTDLGSSLSRHRRGPIGRAVPGQRAVSGGCLAGRCRRRARRSAPCGLPR